METHQAGQEESLVEVEMEMGKLDVVRRPRGSPADHSCCFKCVVVLASVMGLVIVALVAGFILHVFKFAPSFKQDAEPPCKTTKFNITCMLKESDEKGRYDIFTADKAATYLIYGWVKISNITSEEVFLKHKFESKDRTLQKEQSKEKIFFFNEVPLFNKSRISMYFKSTSTESSFHIYELCL